MARKYYHSQKLSQSAEYTTKLYRQKQFLKDNYNRSGIRYKLYMARWNKNLHLLIQLKLAVDNSTLVKGDLALNKNLFPETQFILAQDNNSRVRRSLSVNPNLIPELFPQLFLEFKDDIIYCINNSYEDIYYFRSETQKLLEKYLLLV